MLPPALIPLTWLALLLRYPKRTLMIGLPLLVILASIAAWLILEERSTQRQLDQLAIRMSYAPELCPPDTPLSVELSNNTDHALKDLHWRIAAYRPSENINLVETLFTQARYSGSSPLVAGAQWQKCLPLPSLRAGYRATTLEFHAERRQGHFVR